MKSLPNTAIKSLVDKNNCAFAAFFYSKTIIFCDSNPNIMVNPSPKSQ